jgi:hypothetical protein
MRFDAPEGPLSRTLLGHSGPFEEPKRPPDRLGPARPVWMVRASARGSQLGPKLEIRVVLL